MKTSPSAVKFVVDVMFGRLANYLLFLGFDCEYRRKFPDDKLLKFAREESRNIITRDAKLATRYSSEKVCHLKSTDLEEQLKIVKEKFSLYFTVDKLFTRCPDCNKGLQKIEKEKIEDKIPPQTSRWLDEYCICPECGKIYWEGTHYQAVGDRLKKWDLL